MSRRRCLEIVIDEGLSRMMKYLGADVPGPRHVLGLALQGTSDDRHRSDSNVFAGFDEFRG